jgi:drug/metabolite transporter (DMT)-like permease
MTSLPKQADGPALVVSARSSEPAQTATGQPRLAAELAWLGLLALLWGSSYTLIKVAVETIPPLTLVAGRVSIAAVVLALIAWQRGLSVPGSRSVWTTLLLQAALLNAIPFTLISWGEQHLESGLTAILNATPPIFVFLLTWFWTRHEAVSARKLLGTLAGLGGVVLIIGVDALRGAGVDIVAEVAIVAASVCYALAAINGKRLHQLPPVLTTAGTMLCATLLVAPFALVLDRPWTLAPTVSSLGALVVLAILATAGATLVYFRLLSTLGSVGTTSNAYLRAAVSVALGIILLGERPGWQTGAGLLLVALGVIAINLPAATRHHA